MLNILYETIKTGSHQVFFSHMLITNKIHVPKKKKKGSSIAFCGIAPTRKSSARDKSGPIYLM